MRFRCQCATDGDWNRNDVAIPADFVNAVPVPVGVVPETPQARQRQQLWNRWLQFLQAYLLSGNSQLDLPS